MLKFVKYFTLAALFFLTQVEASQVFQRQSQSLLENPGLQKTLFFESWSVEGEKLRAKGVGLGGLFGWQSDSGADDGQPIILKVRGGFRIQTGSNNSLNLQEFAPNREWLLEEVILRWDPNLNDRLTLNVDVGAIDQSWINSPLLVAPKAFMGAYEKIHWSWSEKHPETGMTLFSQQAIPNNQNLNSRAGGIEEGTPTFFVHGADIAFGGDIVSFFARSLYFEFNELSSGVAGQSQYMGNEVTGISPKNSFLYGFAGWHHQLEVGLWNQFSLWGDYLFNNEAPNSGNTGHQYGLKYHSSKNIDIKLSYFRLEKNASVGFYNDKRIGHNNKKGFLVDLRFAELQFEQGQPFDLSLSYSNIDVIDGTNLLDGRMDLVELYVTFPLDVYL